jgi:hypothetical protein
MIYTIKHKILKASTLATLRVIKAGGKGHRKSQDTPDLLEGRKMRHESFHLGGNNLNSQQGGTTMKTTKTIELKSLLYKVLPGVLTIGILVVLCMPQMIHAQGHSNQAGQHNAIANLAEKEIRAKEQNAAANNNVNLITQISIAGDEERYAVSNEKTVSEESTNETNK